uniref:Small ribosomal subunit protein mS33 n=1 Tax=Sphenodon punctatus TaxID=8508 RepID=A0A8D0GYC7_SPHPU
MSIAKASPACFPLPHGPWKRECVAACILRWGSHAGRWEVYYGYYSLITKLRFFGLYRDERQDFKEEMRRLKKLRCKGKPKKGEGKRALKKK